MKLFKMQLSRKQYHQVSVILAAALILTGFFAYNTYSEKKQYQIFLQNSYQKSFREMVNNVENIKILLDKAEVTASTSNSNSLMTQVWRQASSAADNLGQLPITHTSLSKTEKYLNQLSDYCYAISRQNAANKLMDENELDKISKLNSYAATLLDELHKLEGDVNDGRMRFGELRNKGRLVLKRTSKNTVDMKFGALEDKFAEYPTMIYDGPFSDNVVEGKPKGLTGEKVNLEQAKELAKKFIGENEVSRVNQISSGKGVIETYGLELVTKGNEDRNISIDITKKGGHVLWMLNPREVPEKKLTDQQASEKAKEFLKKQGFGNLQETYFLKNDNTTVITYVGERDGVLIYPDLLKVKVALDNGEIVGFDAYQYLMAPKNRDNLKPAITEEEAKKKVSERVKIERIKLAVIPMPGNKEQLCYEFKGKYKDYDYFIYINAENGNEERILRIIKAENGILTQ